MKAVRITHFSKHPFLVETVDEEDGGLCEGHEEVTESQVHNEVIWQVPQLLVTVLTHTRMGWSEGLIFFFYSRSLTRELQKRKAKKPCQASTVLLVASSLQW